MPRLDPDFFQNADEKFRNPTRTTTPVYHHLNDFEANDDPENGDQLGREGLYLEKHLAVAMPVAHWHSDIELNLLLDGEMTYIINGRQLTIRAGQFALFWAAIPHRTIDVAPDTPLVCIFLPLMDFLALPVSRLARQSLMRGDFITDQHASPIDVALAERWVSEWQSGGDESRRLVDDEIRLRIRRMLLDWKSDMGDDSPAAADSSQGGNGPVGRCERLADLINTHYAEPLSIERLARMGGMHPSTANKSFRQVLGLSVNEYIIRYRLAQAMQRLADTEEPILQVAFGCGFRSNSQFYEIFRQRVGTTPKKFRSRNQSARKKAE